MKNLFAVLSLLFLLSASSQANPQSQSTDAHLIGTITDPTGAAISGVRISAQGDSNSAATPLTTTSTAGGTYTLNLSPGTYRLRLEGRSFTPRETTVTVAAGETRALNFRLELAVLSDQVIITAQSVPAPVGRTTAPTDVITREAIENRQVTSLPQLLEFSPGIAIDRTGPFGGTTSVFLNGGNSDFTKVLVDGTPVNPPGSAVDFSSVTTENIDKVEVVRGAESALYGSDAISGVIQLFTHRGETHIPAFSAYAEGGDLASARGGADLSGILGKFDYSSAFAYFQTDGQGPNDYFLNRTLSGNFGYAFSSTSQLHVSLRNNTSDAGIPGATLEENSPNLDQGYNQKIFAANARWDFTTGSHWQHQIMATESYTRQDSFENPPALFFNTLLSFNRVAINPQSSYVSRNFIATIGYQYEVENGGVSFVNPGHLRRNNQAGYLDFRYTPITRLTLNFGGRVEANDSFGTRFSPRVGGSYLLHYGKGFFGDTRYRAFYGQGIKEPRFDQAFGTDPCFPGNPSLKPEAGKSWSIGFDQKLASDRWEISTDYFYYRFYNVISFGDTGTTTSCPFGTGTYFNTDLAIARGVNVTSQYRFRKWLFVNGHYTYDNSRVVQSPNAPDASEQPGNHLLRRPVNSGSFGLNVNYARVNWNFIGYFTGIRTDSDFSGGTKAQFNPGYARFDMAANYNVTRGLFLTTRITNLFDKQYQDALGYPALGRWYMLGLRYSFSGRN